MITITLGTITMGMGTTTITDAMIQIGHPAPPNFGGAFFVGRHLVFRGSRVRDFSFCLTFDLAAS
jgi:hypothetical protein